MALAKFASGDWIAGWLTSVVGKSAFTVATTLTDSSGNEAGTTGNPLPVVTTPSGGASTIATGQVSVGASATQIVAARTGRRAVLVTNLGTTDVFIGASGVAAGTGQLLAGTKGTTASLEFTGALYGIVASGTQTVSYTELY